MPMFLDIFHHMQSISDSYPLIDAKILKTEMLYHIDHINHEVYFEDQLNNVITETCIQNRTSQLDQTRANYVLNRPMLLEVFFRWSMLIY